MNASQATCQEQTGASETRVHFGGVCLKIFHPYFISDQLSDDGFSERGVSDSQGLLEKNCLFFYVIVAQVYE